jgi:hypothetical protein
MSGRVSWGDLPDAVRDAVTEYVGAVHDATDADVGQNSTAATTLDTDDGRVFLKAVRGISLPMRWLRNETLAGVVAAGIAPGVRFHADVKAAGDDWLVVGFDHVTGRPAGLEPGSPDLAVVGATVDRIASLTGDVPPLRDRWASSEWWAKAAAEKPDVVEGLDVDALTEWSARAAEFVDGDRLSHTDLHGHQFLIDESGDVAAVIDWGRPATAAPWVDQAFLVVRLIDAGHAPADAESWALGWPAWAAAPATGVTAFAAYLAGLWTYRAITTPRPGGTRLAETARRYAAYRLS